MPGAGTQKAAAPGAAGPFHSAAQIRFDRGAGRRWPARPGRTGKVEAVGPRVLGAILHYQYFEELDPAARGVFFIFDPEIDPHAGGPAGDH